MDNSKQSERGAAVVEMAFVTILLVLLAFGVADLGRALFVRIGLQDAAEEGATFASRNHADLAGIVDRTIDSITYPTLAPTDVTVTCPNGAPTGGDLVSVDVSHEFDLITPIPGAWFGGSIVLTRQFTATTFTGECLTP